MGAATRRLSRRSTEASVAAGLFWVASLVAGCHVAGGAGTASPTATAPIPPHPFVAVLKSSGTRLTVSSTTDCGQLPTPFLTDWCSAYVGGSAAALGITKGTLGQTPNFYAWLALELVSDASSFCSNDLVIEWYSISPHLSASPDDQTKCKAYVTSVLQQGYFEVSDPRLGTTVQVPLAP